jgi:hypothetical protein
MAIVGSKSASAGSCGHLGSESDVARFGWNCKDGLDLVDGPIPELLSCSRAGRGGTMQLDFSPWYRWADRANYGGIKYPGIYVLAISHGNISGQAFSFRPEIIYVGMTNSMGGLDNRLWQFDNTIARKHGPHGVAERMLHKHSDYAPLCAQLYVALWHVECDPAKRAAHDLRCMGEVAKAEYECLARYKEQHGELPEFNRPSSPKVT